jgi:hypothetical protein
MPRSSESIAALACALARAQAELTNPEKSLTAIIRNGRGGDGDRSFRYAPLSSGLDIVRKTLGKYEIAALQATAIDQTMQMVNLTTMLAHASGEWIASDWPVCPVADIANPQRMGTALTYARRYALFTLVGIAGEDDLDAPNLDTPTPDTVKNPVRSGNGKRLPDRAGQSQQKAILSSVGSAKLRDSMLAEIADLTSAAAAATWAKSVLPSKNTLRNEDARAVEAAFEVHFTGAARETAEPEAPNTASKGLMKAVRHRNKEHLKFVRTKACLICGRQPSDPHHLRFAELRALGRKPSDEFVVPLCRMHHREVHRIAPKEQAWWRRLDLDPLRAARELWQETQSGLALRGTASPVEAAETVPNQTRVEGENISPVVRGRKADRHDICEANYSQPA